MPDDMLGLIWINLLGTQMVFLIDLKEMILKNKSAVDKKHEILPREGDISPPILYELPSFQ